MVNLRNRNVGAIGRGRVRPARGQALGGGPQPIPPQAPAQAAQVANQYHMMLSRMGLGAAAITFLENLGLDAIDAFSDITEKDIPSIVKELQQNNVLVWQTSQNYLLALCFWVMHQEQLHLNYLPEDFTDAIMRTALQWYQASLDPPSNNLIKHPEKFKGKMKWRDFSDFFIMFMHHMIGKCNFPLSYILRDNEDGDGLHSDDFDIDKAYEEAVAPFSGPFFDLDNSAVFDSLKSYLLGGSH
jgi:hypothetical protein